MAIHISKCSTISDFKVYLEKSDISYPKTFLKTIIKSNGTNIIVNYTSILNKYYDYIAKTLNTVTFSEDDMIKYKFNPKLVCYDLYGTVELWGLLLKVNNMTSALEFKKNEIKVFTTDIFTILNEIFILESDSIVSNNSLVNTTK